MRKTVLLAIVLVASMAALVPGPAAAKDAAKEACKHGGWGLVVRADDSGFTSQKDCKRYVKDGGTPQLPNPLRVECEAAGGSFEDGTPELATYNYVCSLAGLSDAEIASFHVGWQAICFAFPGTNGTILAYFNKTDRCVGTRP